MSTAATQPVTNAYFDSSAVYQPADGPDAVLITGTAYNATNIAGIQISDNGTPLAQTGGFQQSNATWGVVANLSPGKHILTATVTELSGATYTVNSPYQVVTGIQNEPYVYQELDENSAGIFTRVSNYDGAGNLVSQSAVAVNGSGASPLSVAFDPTTTFVGSTEGIITGTTSSYGSVSAIEIFDGSLSQTVDPQTGAVLPGAKALGFATVKPDGSWSFDAHVSPGTHVFTALATGVTVQSAVAQSPFKLVTGVTGAPYVYQEVDYSGAGTVSATTSYAADGSIVGQAFGGGLNVNGGTASGNVQRSAYNDVMTGDGTGSTTFMFRPGFGQDEITNFNYLNAAQSPTGVSHDVISLPQASLHALAQVFAHTTSALDGSAIIHLDRHDTIKLDGVTKADLITHPNVFRFHG